MRIAVIADVHIGVDHLGKINPETGLNTQIEDFLCSLDQAIDYVLDPVNQIEVCVIAGDLYKTRHPTSTQQDLLAQRICRLSKNKKLTLIIDGNHDRFTRKELASTSALIKTLDIPYIHVFTKPGFHIEDNVGFIMIPYIYKTSFGRITQEEAGDKYMHVVEILRRRIFKEQRVDNVVLIGHQMVEGVVMPSIDTELEEVDDLLVPIKALHSVDAAFFGHVHRYQVLHNQDPLVVIPGPTNNSKTNEAKYPKGLVVYDTSTKQHQFVPLKVRSIHDLKIDITASNHPMTNIQNALSQVDIPNSVIGLTLKLREEQMVDIDNRWIERELDKAFFNLGLKNKVSRIRRTRNVDLDEKVSPNAALRSYFANKSNVQTIKDNLIQEGDRIIAECS